MPEVFSRFFSFGQRRFGLWLTPGEGSSSHVRKNLWYPGYLEPWWGFLADAAIQSDARKITLPKYGIKKLKTKNFELATLIDVSMTKRNRLVAYKRCCKMQPLENIKSHKVMWYGLKT